MPLKDNEINQAFGHADVINNRLKKGYRYGVTSGGGGGAGSIAVQDDPPTNGELVWIETDTITTKTLPEVNDGATNASDTWSSNKISTELSSKMSSTLLWTNPSPTATFNAQTIPLDLSGYDAVRILMNSFAAANNTDIAVCEIPVGCSSQMQYFYLNTTNTTDAAHFFNGVSRNATVTTTGVAFGQGQMVYIGNAYVNWDNRAIPWKIYGVHW